MRSSNQVSFQAILGMLCVVLLVGCNGSSAPPPPISVTLSPATTQLLDQGQSVSFMATLVNDSANKGVTWTVSCGSASCGTVSPATSTSGVNVKYTAPTPVTTNLTVTITSTSVAQTSKYMAGSITVSAPPALVAQPPAIPAATVGQNYSLSLMNFVSGGAGSTSWSIKQRSPALPSGLTLNNTTGVVSGTPTSPTTSAAIRAASQARARPEVIQPVAITFVYTDSGNPPESVDVPISITVDPVPLAITSATTATGMMGAKFSFTVTASGGVPPYTFSATGLPTGLSLDPSSGVISGTLNASGSFAVNLTVTSTDPATATGTLTIKIMASAPNPVPFISEPLVPDAVAPGGAGFTLTVNGTGFNPASVVQWDGSARQTTFVNESSLTATIQASDIAKVGTATVTVVSPSPGGSDSNAVFLPVTTSAGTVITAETIPYQTSTATYLTEAAGDFNQDGKLDLVATDDSGIQVMLGNGDGTFKAPVLYPASGATFNLIVGDFNGDGKLDIAAAALNGSGTRFVTIFLGNGDGTFQTHLDAPIDNSIPYGGALAAGDLNGDGKLDLVVGYQGGNAVSVLLGNGDGTFQPFTDYTTGAEPGAVVIGDFNGDGILDIASANFGNFGGNTVSILLGNGDGTFKPHVEYSTTDYGPISIVAADFNGDGKLDLAVACSCGHSSPCGRPGTVAILLGNGDGSFKPGVIYDADEFPYALTTGDFNGDGKLDLALANLDTAKISFLLGNGDGTFKPHFETQLLNSDTGASGGPTNLIVGDFNGDGLLDLVTNDISTSGQSQFPLLTQILAPAAGFGSTSLNLGDQLVGVASTPQSVSVINTGRAPLTISGVSVGSGFTETDTCSGSTLQPGASCKITITFTPTQVGPLTASLTVTDNAGDSPQSLSLTGFGLVSGVDGVFSTSSLTFGTQLVATASAPQSVSLTNYGTAALNIASITASANFGQTNNCSASLPSAASCSINVTFTPTTAGPLSGSAAITDNATGSPQTINLNGVGTYVQLNPASLGFGGLRAGSTKQLTSTLTNTGTAALSISSVTIAGANPGDFSQVNNCGASIAAGASCTIQVTFKPTAAGAATAVVNISDSDPGSPQLLELSGRGIVCTRKGCKVAVPASAKSVLAATKSIAAPAPSGASKVGTQTVHMVDATRSDPYLSNGTSRELMVRLWYPATIQQGCQLAEYTSPAVWGTFSELLGVPLPAVLANSCLDAPVSGASHPVLVFTHGYTGTFTDYTYLFEDLASRGYIVASVDHTYEATAVEFPDGRIAASVVGSHLDESWVTDDATLQFALSVRLDDLRFVLDELQRLNSEAGGAFAGKLDLSRVALAGHSFGGWTTLQGLQQESRFRTGILLDAYLPEITSSATQTPILLLATGRTEWTANERSLWSNLQGPRFAVNLMGTEHATPSDAVWIARGAIASGVMGESNTISAIRDYVAAFLDTNLRGEPASPLLSGPASTYPDAGVTTQQQSLAAQR